MFLKKVNYFFHKLSIAIKTKQLSIVVTHFSGLDNILKSLFDLFLIYGYTENQKKNTIEIFLKYDANGDSVIKEINFLLKSSVHYVVTLKQLNLFLERYPYSNGFVLTRSGVLDFKQCIEKKSAGLLLVIIK